MSRFFDPLQVSTLDGIIWTVGEEMSYEIGAIGSGLKVTVPAGRLTDFGSIPKKLHGWISPIGPGTRPYVLHDDLYKRQILTRWMSDLVLREALDEMAKAYPRQMTIWRRRAVYWGVRFGGWIAWNKHKKKNAVEKRAAKRLESAPK